MIGGMSSSQAMVSVGIAMVLQDQFTNQANSIAKAYRGMMEEIYSSSMAPRGLTEMLWSRGAAGMALASMGGLIDSYRYFADVQNDVFWATEMTNGSLRDQEALLKRVEEVNLLTPLTNKDLSSASRFMAMAGNTNKAIQQMLEPVGMLAGVFNMQAGGKGGVADLFTNISMMFGRNLENQQEAFNVANELYAVVTGSNTNLQDLAQAITYSGSEMRRAGYGLKETAASIGAMGNYGIQGSAAGTALANMMRYIQLSASGQKQKGSDMLKAVGIDAKSLMDSEGHLISLGEIYRKIFEVTKGLNTFQKNSFFYNVFGVRGTREIAAMTQMIEDAAGGASKYEELLQKMESASATNKLGDAYQRWLESAEGQISMFRADIDNLVTTTGKQLEPLFTNVLKITNAILSVMNTLAGSTMGGVILRGVAIGTTIQLAVRAATALYGGFRIATTSASQLASMGNRLSSGPAAANGQYVIMEAHLRTLIVLMSEYLAMQGMIPKGGIGTPWGTVFSQQGRARVTNPSAGVRGMGINNGLNTMSGMLMGSGMTAAGARAAGAAGGQQVARTLGSRILGFMGGPWGIVITMALPMILDGVRLLVNKKDEEIEAIKEQFNPEVTNQHQQDLLREVIAEATRSGIITGMGQAKLPEVNVNVDGMGGNSAIINFMGDPNNPYTMFP